MADTVNVNEFKFLSESGLKHYDDKIKAYLAAQNEAVKTEIKGFVGELPTGTTATTVVDYIDAKTANIASDETVGKLAERVGDIEKDYLVEADKTELQGNIDLKAEKSAFDEVSGKVTKLIGEDADKSVREIANAELAKQLIAENADEALNSLEEIAAWIQSHPGDASAMNQAIIALQNKVDTGDKTVSAYVTEAINALSIGEYAKASELTELAGRVETLEKINHNAYIAADTALKEELEGKINGKADAQTVTDMDTAYKAADTALSGRLDALESVTHTHTEITTSFIDTLFENTATE